MNYIDLVEIMDDPLRKPYAIISYFYWHGLTLIPSWISNHMSSWVLDENI